MTSNPSRPASLAQRLRTGLEISFVSLVVLIVGFELVARTGWIHALDRDVLDPMAKILGEESNVEAHPYLAYAPKKDFHHNTPTEHFKNIVNQNSLGFRGRETTWQKPPNTYRIVCIGGSSCFGQSESSDEKVWTVRMEGYLNQAGLAPKVEVINGGCRGYSTFEMLINLEFRLIDFQPDLVICYESINDARCALYPGCVPDNSHFRAVFPVIRKSAADRLLERSYAYLAWRRYGTNWLAGEMNLGSYVIRDEGKYTDDWAQPTDLERGFANFRRNLHDIVAVARRNGAKVLLSTQAMRFTDLAAASSYGAQKAAILRCRDELRTVGKDDNVPVIDTAKMLEDALAAELAGGSGKDDLFVGEVHPTDKGSDMIGRFIADQVLALGFIPKK